MHEWIKGFYNYWYQWVRSTCTGIFFSKITVQNRANLPKEGPALYLALHRNGAVDGFVYYAMGRPMTTLISRQLRSNAFIRLFFSGIVVARKKDVREHEDYKKLNQRAMKKCIELLQDGGELLMFPEGTSTLGPSHLPFQGGAAHIASKVLAFNDKLPIIPVGIRYECAWAFRSRAEIYVGKPIATEGADKRELKIRFEKALEEAGVNVASPVYQEQLQKLAYISTLGTNRSYTETLKRFETSIPPHLEEQPDEPHLLYHQGVPLFPIAARWPYLLTLVLFGPLVAAAMLFNAIPLFGTWAAASKLADDRNVIAFWKIIVGAPIFVFWSGAVTVFGFISGRLGLLAAYWIFTLLGHSLYYRTRKLMVTVYNGYFHAAFRPKMIAYREAVLSALEQTKNNPGNLS